MAGLPGERSARTSAGTTQPSAERETDVARPTTVRRGFPGALVMVTHNPELAARYTHRAVHLLDGRIAGRTGHPLAMARAAEAL